MTYKEVIMDGNRVSTLTLIEKMSSKDIYTDISIKSAFDRTVCKKAVYAYLLTRNTILAAEVLHNSTKLDKSVCEEVVAAVASYFWRHDV